MEAMSCKTPVIATEVEGVPELVEQGWDGVLVNPADPTALAASIQRLSLDPQLMQEMSKRGRAKVERYFNSTLSALEMKRLLELRMSK